MPAKKIASDVPIYQIKVTLDESKPPIWRRIQVPNDITLAYLHRILQVVMGWENYHLHQFIVGERYYGEPHPEDTYHIRNEKWAKLSRVVAGEGFTFVYEYDYGDDWLHTLLIEKVLAPKPDALYPCCLAGERACPPEDVGGMRRYARFLAAIRDPDHDEHGVLLGWIGGEFDPEAFDLEAVNAALKVLR